MYIIINIIRYLRDCWLFCLTILTLQHTLVLNVTVTTVICHYFEVK